MTQRYDEDKKKIQDMINDMFDAVSWSPESAPDWDAFGSTFVEGAVLVPSARPARLKQVEEFVAGMTGQRESGALTALSEVAISHDIEVFANVAIALSAFRVSVNGGEESRGVNAFLFVRDHGEWRVAGTAWDAESEHHPVQH